MPGNPLTMIKLLHTLVWGFFASCIVAIPVLAVQARYGWAALFIGVVAIEVLILACHSWRCPLTDVAARYTGDRRANFDIYLPEWLARNNKWLFGALYVAGILLTAGRRWLQ